VDEPHSEPAYWPPEEKERDRREDGREPDAQETDDSRPRLHLLALGALLLAVAALNLYTLPVERPEPLPGEDESAARASLFVATEAVEQYRAEHHSLPGSLDQIGLGGLGLVYERTPDGYRLRYEASGTALDVDSRSAARTLLESLSSGVDRQVVP
jgi:hypothetical protein